MLPGCRVNQKAKPSAPSAKFDPAGLPTTNLSCTSHSVSFMGYNNEIGFRRLKPFGSKCCHSFLCHWESTVQTGQSLLLILEEPKKRCVGFLLLAVSTKIVGTTYESREAWRSGAIETNRHQGLHSLHTLNGGRGSTEVRLSCHRISFHVWFGNGGYFKLVDKIYCIMSRFVTT